MKKSWIFVACAIVIVGRIRAENGSKSVLSDPERTQLLRDKVLLTHKSYKQIFEPYVYTNKPLFITTDSVLNA